MNTKPKRYGRQPINGRQIKQIHTIVTALGMADDEYRTLLLGMFGAGSCKELSWAEAEDLVSELNGKAGNASPPKGGSARRQPYAELDGRPGMATGAQCRMIAAMWADVSRMESAEARDKALRQFLYRIVAVDHFRFLTRGHVERVVKALESMGAMRRAA